MTNHSMTIFNETFLEIAKDLTELAFKNAVSAVDQTYGTGAAIKNPQLLASIISLNEAIYTNLANEHYRILEEQKSAQVNNET